MALFLALVHYPVVNRRGEIIASAITNLDLHDLARAACTYNIPVCYVVTPLKDQQALAKDLLRHWCEGVGRELHPDRATALNRLKVLASLDEAREDIWTLCGTQPIVWATSARESVGTFSHREARKILQRDSAPFLLLFGTAWGLSESVLKEVDAVLEPIRGVDGYNHLSVRCAAAIMMDRLLSGEDREESFRNCGVETRDGSSGVSS
jgi:hypothetical protein